MTSQEVTAFLSTAAPEYTSIAADKILKIIYLCIGLLGFLGNLLVIVVILYTKSLIKTTTNRYLLNQSCIDLWVAIMLVFTTYFAEADHYLEGPADELFCRLWLTRTPLWGLLFSSTYNLVFMTMERYLCVVHPIWHKTSYKSHHFYISVIVVWLFGVTYYTAIYASTTRIQKGTCNLYAYWPSITFQKAFGVFTIVIQFFVPLSMFAFCYTKMAMKLRTKVAPGPSGNHVNTVTSDSKRESTNARARKNIFKMLALLTACFVLCWIFNQIYFLLFNLGYDGVDFRNAFYHFTVVAVFCNCCINPFVYMLKYEQFQRGLRQLLRIEKSQSQSGNGSS